VLHRSDQFQKLGGQNGAQHRVVFNIIGPVLETLLGNVRRETKRQRCR